MLGLSNVDWVVVLIILLSTIQAAAQGFFVEFFSLAGAVVGYLLAAWEYPSVAAWLARYVTSPWIADIAGFFAIFLAVVLLAGMLGRLISRAVRGIGLRWFDRLLGGAFGLLRGIVISAVIALALAAFAPQWGGLQQSRVAPFMLVTSRALIWAAPAKLRQRFWDGWNLLRSVPEHISTGEHSKGQP